jgi:hypothetical protein
MVQVKQVYACVDQLDLCSQLLREDAASYGRLALILTDNVVELMLHAQCEEHFLLQGFRALGDAKKREKALGQHFEEKPKLICKLGKISELERDFILTAHKYRSQAYHVGLLYEDIMPALAWEYHALACCLFGRFPPQALSWRLDDAPSVAVKRHFGSEGINFVFGAANSFSQAAQSLDNARPGRSEELPLVLSRSAVGQVARLQDDLEFLARNNQYGLDETAIIDRLQFYRHVFGQRALVAGLDDFAYDPRIGKQLQQIRSTWAAPIKQNPCSRWSRRARALAQESEPLLVVRKYENLLAQMSELADAVSREARALSTASELEVDRRREQAP